jgi:hypothetical protein
MAIRKSSSSGIPFGNTAGRPAAPGTGQLYSNGQLGRLELYTETGWQNIVQETPGIASITGTYNESAGSGTFVISGTNFVTGGIAYAVGTNGVEYQASSSVTNSIVQMTAIFSNLSPAYEPYDVKVLNPSNLFGLLPDAFYINDSPIWSTSSGSLGTYSGSASIQLSATDDESNTITYSVTSGALPSGLSISSSGLISGTITANPATYTFTISASDGVNTGQTRSFSIIVPAPTVSGGTLSSDSTYYYRTFAATGNFVVSGYSLNADILTIAGGGGAGSDNYSADRGGGGGGAGGIVYYANKSLSTGTYAATIGGGGNGGNATGNNSGMNGTNGIDSQFGSLALAIGGGFGGGHGSTQNSPGATGGSGGGASNSSLGSSALQTSGAGYTGYGNAGGDGSSQPNYAGGGGGGAGSAGAAGVNSTGGAGGNGTNAFSSWLSGISSAMTAVSGWATATSTGYIAGGGGAKGQVVGAGGYGGGASGVTSGTGISGVTNTGSGGGGTRNATAGAGGSGLIVVRYTKASVGG